MRIGILTFPNSSSHGASLQMYALYQILRLLGHDPEIINYMSDNVIHQRIPTHKKTNFKTHLKQLFASLFVKDSKALFQSFENKLVKYPNKTITTSKESVSYTHLDVYKRQGKSPLYVILRKAKGSELQ